MRKWLSDWCEGVTIWYFLDERCTLDNSRHGNVIYITACPSQYGPYASNRCLLQYVASIAYSCFKYSTSVEQLCIHLKPRWLPLQNIFSCTGPFQIIRDVKDYIDLFSNMVHHCILAIRFCNRIISYTQEWIYLCMQICQKPAWIIRPKKFQNFTFCWQKMFGLFKLQWSLLLMI